jgi:hypothetical protein
VRVALARSLVCAGCCCCAVAVWAQAAAAGKAPAARQAASAAAGPAKAVDGAAPAAAKPVDKEILNGPVSVKVEVEGTVQRVVIQSQKPYAPVHQYPALDAANAVQADVALACGKLCRPARMKAPKIDGDGVLRFDVAVQGLDRSLTLPDITALLQGKPLAKTAAQAAGVTPPPGVGALSPAAVAAAAAAASAAAADTAAAGGKVGKR